jgi:pectin methylesterase-like acyl-CoA thioesterase
MKRSTLALTTILVAAAAAAAAAATPVARAAGTLCVGSKPGCFSTIQAAVNAARDGDTITVASGTFVGGVTIDVSVNLIGAGSSRTIIQGGGPVLTIGQEQADTAPTVSISRVTITGGFNTSSPDHAVTQGGGIEIPQGSFQSRNGLGATVTIIDSVITGN